MDTFLNTYKPPSVQPLEKDLHLKTPPEEYDFNYVFEVKTLRSDRVELRPYVVSSPRQTGIHQFDDEAIRAIITCSITLGGHPGEPRDLALVIDQNLGESRRCSRLVRDHLSSSICTPDPREHLSPVLLLLIRVLLGLTVLCYLHRPTWIADLVERYGGLCFCRGHGDDCEFGAGSHLGAGMDLDHEAFPGESGHTKSIMSRLCTEIS